MDAIILAAGKGTRLGLDEIPKCLIEFDNITLIRYQIECLRELGVDEIFIVTGYNSEKIMNHLKNYQVNFIHNPEFDTTNNIQSVLVTKKFLKNEFICMYGDLFFEKNILKKCINSKHDMTLMVETDLRDETTRIKIENNKISHVNKNINFEEADGNFIGMMKCSKNLIDKFFQSIENVVENNLQAYYTIGIEKMIQDGIIINFETTDGLLWTDIDTAEDLIIAKQVFARDND